MTATAAEHLAEAERNERAAAESFERCDTDGFLSQWAHGMLAQEHRLAAQIAENGGRARFVALFDAETGELVPAKWIGTRYGMAFGLLPGDGDDPRSRFTGWFRPSQAEDPRRAFENDRKRGYRVGYVLAPAKAELRGGNALTVTAVAARTDGGWSRDVEIADDGTDGNGGPGAWYTA